MKVNKGYLLPENVEPVDDWCMLVWYPGDELYRRALVGSILSLGTWGVWEKDELKRGALAAQRWKQSNLRTLNQKFDCEIADELEDDGTMAINVTVNCNCGGGGGGCGCNYVPFTPLDPSGNPYTIDDIRNAPRLNPDEGLPYPPGFSSQEEYDAFKCQMAGQIVQDWIDSLTSVEILSGLGVFASGATLLDFFFPLLVGAGEGSVVGGIFAGLMALGLSATAAVVVIVGALLAAITGGFVLWQYFGRMADQLASVKDQVRCDLYQSEDENAAYQILIDYTNNAVAAVVGYDQEQDGIFLELIEKLIDVLIPEEIVFVLFRYVANLVRGDVTYVCDECGGGPTGPTFVVDWDNVVIPGGSVLLGDTAAIQDDGTGNLVMQVHRDSSGNNGGIQWPGSNLYDLVESILGVRPPSIQLTAVSYLVKLVSPPSTRTAQVVLGTESKDTPCTELSDGNWKLVTMTLQQVFAVPDTGTISFGLYMLNPGTGGTTVYYDNITFYGVG